jgi:hypothetical protein
MSRSETTVDLVEMSRQLDELTAEVTRADTAAGTPETPAGVPASTLRAVLSSAIRLYAAVCERSGTDVPPIDTEVSTTDAVVLSCALLKARDLNPFDLALWFSRGRAGG